MRRVNPRVRSLPAPGGLNLGINPPWPWEEEQRQTPSSKGIASLSGQLNSVVAELQVAGWTFGTSPRSGCKKEGPKGV